MKTNGDASTMNTDARDARKRGLAQGGAGKSRAQGQESQRFEPHAQLMEAAAGGAQSADRPGANEKSL
jgi:hypothetical protein